MFKHISRRHENFTYLLILLLFTVIGGLLVYKEPTITGAADYGAGTCPGNINEDSTISADISTTDANCITLITNSNIQLDCQGHTITCIGCTGTKWGIGVNTLSGVTIKNCKVTGFNYDYYLFKSSSTNITNSTSTSALKYGLYIYGTGASANNNNITNSSFTGAATNDIYLDALADNNIFLNTTYSSSTVLGSLTRKWYLDVYVNDSTNPLADVNVTAMNASGDIIFKINTSTDGFIPQQVITEYFEDNDLRSMSTNYTINVNKTGYNNDSLITNITSSRVLKFNLTSTAVVVSNTAPYNLTLNYPTNNSQVNNTNSINFNFSFLDRENQSLNCSLIFDSVINSTNITSIEGNHSNYTLTGITYASHNWSVNCSDYELSNSSGVFYFSVNDTLKPGITLNAPVNGYNSSSNSIVFNWTATDNKDLNITCNLTIAGVVNRTNLNLTNGTAYNITVSNFPDNSYLWNVTCWDATNNTNTSLTRNFTVDATAPVINLETNASLRINVITNFTFSYNVSDTNPVKNCSLIVNGKVNMTNTTITKDTMQNFTINISSGTYNWSVNCTDFVGNTGNSTNATLTILSCTVGSSCSRTGYTGSAYDSNCACSGGTEVIEEQTSSSSSSSGGSPSPSVLKSIREKETAAETTPAENTGEETPEAQAENFIETVIRVEKEGISDTELEGRMRTIMEKFWRTQNYSKIVQPPEFIYNNETNTTDIIYKIIPLNATLLNYSLYINVSKCAALYADMVAFKEDYEFEVLIDDPLFKLSFDEIKEPITVSYEVKGEILEYCRKLLLALGIAENILEQPKPKAVALSPKKTAYDIIRSFRNAFPGSLLALIPFIILILTVVAYEEAHAVVALGMRTNARKITRLVSRAVVDLTLFLIVIANIADFSGVLPPYLAVLKQVFGVAATVYFIYKLNIPRIILGVKNRLADISIIIAYYLIISTTLLGIRFHEVNEFFSTITVYLTENINIVILAGIVIILILSLLWAAFANIKKPSLMAILKQEGRPKNIVQIALRFILIALILLAFDYIAFKPFVEWVDLAIDAPLLMVALCIFIYLALKHHKKLTVEKVMEEPLEEEDTLYKKFFEEFEFKKKIVFGVSGLLALNALVDAFVFLLPNDFYLESISIAGHIPVTAYIIKELPLMAFIPKIAMLYAYILNTIFMFSILTLPMLIWYMMATGRKLVFKKWPIALFFSSFIAYMLMPVYKMGQLTAEKVIGADIQTRSILYSDFFINKFIPNPIALTVVVSLSLSALLFVYLFYKRWSRLFSIAMVSIASVFFGMHVYFYISSTWFYALDIGIKLAAKAALDRYVDLVKIALLLAASLFYYAIFFVFIWEIFLGYKKEEKLEKRHKKHAIMLAKWIHKAHKAGLKPRHTKRLLKKSGWPIHIVKHAHRHAKLLRER